MSTKIESLDYFKYAYYESDQESFLMWLFNTKDQSLYQLRNDIIKSLLPEKIRDTLDLNNATITTFRQYLQIDIIVKICIEHGNKYVLGIEHKVHSEFNNKISNYCKKLKKSLPNYTDYFFAVLAPHGLNTYELKHYREEVKASGEDESNFTLLQNEYVDLFKKYSISNSFVKDYIENFFVSSSYPVKKMKNKLHRIIKSIVGHNITFVDGENQELETYQFGLRIKRTIFVFTIKFDSEDYLIRIDDESIRNTLNEKEIIKITTKQRRKFKIYKDNSIIENVQTLGDIKKLFEILENSLS